MDHPYNVVGMYKLVYDFGYGILNWYRKIHRMDCDNVLRYMIYLMGNHY